MEFSISDVRITPIRRNDGLVAIGSVVVNNSLYLGSIGIHRKLDGSGYRLTYKNKKAGTENRTVYHPLTPELSKAVETALFRECQRLIC